MYVLMFWYYISSLTVQQILLSNLKVLSNVTSNLTLLKLLSIIPRSLEILGGMLKLFMVLLSSWHNHPSQDERNVTNPLRRVNNPDISIRYLIFVRFDAT